MLIEVTYKQKVTETWNGDVDVPNEIVNKGDKAIEEWLKSNKIKIENEFLDSTEIDETLIDVQQT